MLFNYIDSEQMKQNVDINIFNGNQNGLTLKQKPQRLVKRELFKEINPQNTSKTIKKAAYIIDSEEEQAQLTSSKKDFTPQKSIDQVSQIIESLSRQSSLPVSPKVQPQYPIKLCHEHKLQIFTYNYCLECSQYLICTLCINSIHSNHMILTFTSQPQSKQLTKRFLIQKIEQTLQKLKSSQNDLKNKTYELEIIVKNTKKMQNQVIIKLQTTFLQIQQRIKDAYEKDYKQYENRIQQFYMEYNSTGDQLRENLLSIIEESFDINSFTPNQVSKQPPQVPNLQITRFKSSLQKTKKFYKSISESLDSIRQRAQQLSKFNSKALNQVIGKDKKASTQKYEKFLSESCYGNHRANQAKSSLIRILDTLSS